MLPSRTISPNSTFGGNNSPKVISHKSFSCKRNSNFIFYVWKLLSFNFSILQASKMDDMVVNRTMPKNKTPRALKLSTKTKKPKTHPMFQSFQKNSISPSFKNNHALIPYWKLTTDQWENKNDKNINFYYKLSTQPYDYIGVQPHGDVTYPRRHMGKAIISCMEIFHSKLN